LKGQHIAIESLVQLRRKGVEAQLLLMGDATLHEGNAYHQRIEQWIQTHQLNDAVKLVPGQNDVALFYHAIDVFALCSVGETFGNVTIEAMAMGLPIIGTNRSGTPEILDHGHCGALIPPHDADVLAEVIQRLKGDQSLRTRLGNRAKERFNENYTLQQSVVQLMQVIHEVEHAKQAKG
ncbi:MAG: glycosyltransferase family 4 protein, partial [Flavobacteriales bacterium]